MYINKKKFIFFPKLQPRHFLFLFFFVISCIKNGMQRYLSKNQGIDIEFLKLYMYNLGDFLTVIPFLILKKRVKTEKEEISPKDTDAENNFELIYNNQEQKQNDFSAFKKIFIITIADFIAQIGSVILKIITTEQNLEVKKSDLNSLLIFNIIAILLLSIFILRKKFYKHHLFAILINILCLIILAITDIQDIIDAGDDIKLSLLYILVKIIGAILYSLENVLAKILFLYNYMTTYALLVNKAIFHFIYLIIFSFPFIFIKFEDENGESKLVFSMIVDFFENKINILIVISFIIISFFYNNLLMLIIDVFSPDHFVISRIFENVGIFIIDLIFFGADKEKYLIIKIIMFILLILSAFIYNEFLVLNICGLSKNTKLFLDYEAENEILLNRITENFDDQNSNAEENNHKSLNMQELKKMS